jgi:hypothetical protein
MNIKNLKVGMEIKNYKKLCELLGVEPKTSNSKKKQLKEFKKYFEWDKKGQQVIIKKVYSKPKAFTEDEMVELLILNLLANTRPQDGYSIIATKRNFFEKLHMVNENFKYCFYNPKSLSSYKNIEEDIVTEVIESIDKSLENKLNNALQRLSNRKILVSTNVRMICYDDKVKDSQFGSNMHRVATDEEVAVCTRIEWNVLKELECVEYRDIFKRKIQCKYFSMVKKELEKIHVESFYIAKKIIFTKSDMPEVMKGYMHKYKLSKRNYNKYSTNVNNEIQAQTNNNAQKRHEKAILLLEGGKAKEEIGKNFEEKIQSIGKCAFGRRPLRKEDYIEQAKIQREYEKELDMIAKMEMRADKEYMKHVDTLIGILIDGSARSLIYDIEKTIEENN